MTVASMRREIGRLKREADARKRERPEERLAEFERAFNALHVLVPDPSKDDGGPPDIPSDITPPTTSWTPAKLGPDQYGYLFSDASANVIDSGRRSFKSQGLMRRTVRAAITSALTDGEFYLGGPTERQVKTRIWKPLKKLIPPWAVRGGSVRSATSEVDMQIDLWNGCFIRCAGLDVPERIEGGCWDGGGITEFGNCRPDVGEHIEPMLVRPGAWIDYEGTPELGAVEYKRLSDAVRNGEVEGAARHYWSTEDVLHLWLGREDAEKRLEKWRGTMSARVYDQEARGLWVVAGGRAYFEFHRDLHAVADLRYRPELPLIFCFDFNVKPGVAVVCQEQPNENMARKGVGKSFTAVIDEVWIPDDSNTPKVVAELLARWGHHDGVVIYSGDPAGGARNTSATEGSDWVLIGDRLRARWGRRAVNRVPKSAPAIRGRINAMDERLRTSDGTVRMLIDRKCRHLLDDLDAVTYELLEDSKKKSKAGDLTHMSDALGYFVAEEHPAHDAGTRRAGGF